MAHDLNISLKTIYRWFSGESMPSINNAVRLAKMLHVDKNDLYHFLENQHNDFINKRDQSNG